MIYAGNMTAPREF